MGFVRLPGAAEVFHQSKNEWTAGAEDGVNFVTLSGFGGMSAAVSSASSEKASAAAWNLYEFLTSQEQMSITFPPATRTLCRSSQMSYPDVWLPDDITAAEGGSYLGEVSRSLEDRSFVAELPVTGRAQFRAVLTEGLSAGLTDEAAAGEMLKNVAVRWSEIAENLGVATVRDSYRRSLGLRPLGAAE